MPLLADTVVLTAEERQWLQDNAHELTLAPTPNFHPLEFINETGEFSGFAGDLFGLMEKRLGVKFKLVYLPSWQAVVEAGKKRTIALTSLVQPTPEREGFWRFSSTYLEVPAVIIAGPSVRKSLGIQDLAGLRVGAVKAFAAIEYIKSFHPRLAIEEVADDLTGLRKAAVGELDVMISELPSAGHLIEKEGLGSLRLAGETGFTYRYSIGCRQDWPILHQIMQKALDSISLEERRDIYRRWIHLRVPDPPNYSPFLIAGAVLMSLLGLVWGWNRSLRSQVGHRTRALEAALCDVQSQERRLKESEERYRLLYQGAYDAILMIQDEKVVDCNPRALEIFGGSRAEVIGRSIFDFAPPMQPDGSSTREKALSYLQDVSAGPGKVFPFQHWRLDHTPIFTEVSISTFSAGGQSLLLALVRDVTERKKAEEAIRQREEQFRKMFEIAPFAIAITRLSDGKYLQVNPAFEKMTGFAAAELLGKSSIETIIPEAKAVVPILHERLLRDGKIEGQTLRDRRKDGSLRHFVYSSAVFTEQGEQKALTILVDMTETKRLEEELRQAQKMDVVGQLAGGISHDFNNMLTGIMGNAELLALKLNRDSPLLEFTGAILEASKRAADLTRKLLTFSRKGQLATVPLDVHTPLKATISLLEATIDRRISIVGDFQAKEACVHGDSTLLQNAFLNLGINSRDAMPEGGTLTFSTVTVHLDESACRSRYLPMAPGLYVEVSVSDTGSGIPPENLEKIFEPFFTTKEIGKGTGLGLATVYGTIREHDGGVTVISEVGKGTTFRVYLPVHQSESGAPKAQGRGQEPRGGSGRILVIEDESLIRILVNSMLKRLGYEVVLAVDGQEGIEVFEREQGRFDLVLSDVVMPRLNGRQVLQRLKERYPEVKVLFGSGFHAQETREELIKLGGVGYLQKPYDLAELGQAISQVLTSQPPEHPAASTHPRADT